MKKNIVLAGAIALAMTCATLNAQVTVGAGTLPQATLDVVTSTTDTTTPEGIIAPRMTGDDLTKKNAAYLDAQDGAFVYVTAAISAATPGKTEDVTAKGYYYYDAKAANSVGTGLWKAASAVGNIEEILAQDIVVRNGAHLDIEDGKLVMGLGENPLSEPTVIQASATNNLTLSGTGTGAVTISAPLAITSGTPGANKVLTSDADGNATWQTPAAASSNFWGLTGNTVTATDYLGTNNDMALRFKVGDGSTYTNNTVPAGYIYSNQTAIGANALGKSDAEMVNTAFGASALKNNDDGKRNVAVGYNALGANVGGESNTAVGTNALLNLSTGDYNTGIGDNTLGVFTSGSHNIAVGSSIAPSGLKNGSYNILIGDGTQTMPGDHTDLPDNSNNMLNIADVIFGTNMYNWDGKNGVAAKGRIGIGTDAPQNALEVNGSTRTDSLYIDVVESTTGNSRNLVWNEVSKKVEYSSADAVSIMTFLQSSTETPLAKTMNTKIPVMWNRNTDNPQTTAVEGDVIINTLTDIDPSGEYFELREDGVIEMSGYVGYIANLGTSNGGIVIVNATIQIQRAGSSTWEDYTSVRGAYSTDITAFRQTLSIPPALLIAKAGDKMRMIIVMAPEGLGSSHQNPSIVVPYGTKFSKSIKIVQVS
jgi:hypothetical protein